MLQLLLDLLLSDMRPFWALSSNTKKKINVHFFGT